MVVTQLRISPWLTAFSMPSTTVNTAATVRVFSPWLNWDSRKVIIVKKKTVLSCTALNERIKLHENKCHCFYFLFIFIFFHLSSWLSKTKNKSGGGGKCVFRLSLFCFSPRTALFKISRNL